jgi:predicted nucleic acid-binding protein
LGLLTCLGQGPVAIDTSPFIYYIEDHPELGPLLEPVFQAIAGLELAAFTSELTLLETLVQPLRLGDQELVDEYTEVLIGSDGLELIPVDRVCLQLAAEIRAHARVKTPDAIQLAAAALAGCSSFLTNDRRLPQLPWIEVVCLDLFRPRQDLVMEPPPEPYS